MRQVLLICRKLVYYKYERFMKASLRYFLLLIHYWFPVCLGLSVTEVIHRATGMPIIPAGLALYLLGICAAYSVDRLLDNDDAARPRWLTAALFTGFSISAVLGFFLAIHTSIQTLSALLIFSIITLLYSRLKKFPFLKFFIVSIIWTWAGVALPFANHHWFAWQFWTMQTSIPLVLLIACGCILCDFKDIRSDASAHVRSLPVMLGLRKTVWVISLLLLVTAILSLEQRRLGLTISSAALILLAQFPRLLSLEAVGPLLVDALLSIPGFLIILHWV